VLLGGSLTRNFSRPYKLLAQTHANHGYPFIRRALRYQFLVERFHLGEWLGPTERAATSPQPARKRSANAGSSRIFSRPASREAQSCGNDEARASIHHRRDSAPVGHQDRRPARDRFRRGIAEILILRGQDEQIRIPIRGPLGVAIQWSREQNPTVQTNLRARVSRCRRKTIPSSGPANTSSAGREPFWRLCQRANASNNHVGLFFDTRRPRKSTSLTYWRYPIGYESGLAEGIPRAHQFRSYAPQSDGPEYHRSSTLVVLFRSRNQAARTAKHSTAKTVWYMRFIRMFRTMGWNMPMGSTNIRPGEATACGRHLVSIKS